MQRFLNDHVKNTGYVKIDKTLSTELCFLASSSNTHDNMILIISNKMSKSGAFTMLI